MQVNDIKVMLLSSLTLYAAGSSCQDFPLPFFIAAMVPQSQHPDQQGQVMPLSALEFPGHFLLFLVGKPLLGMIDESNVCCFSCNSILWWAPLLQVTMRLLTELQPYPRCSQHAV